MTEKKDPPYFMYFPGNYRWSAAFINMLSSGPYGGSEIGELHKIIQYKRIISNESNI